MLAKLEDKLNSPFAATVLGDLVQVVVVDGEASSERRGVMVSVEKDGRSYSFPLSEIEPVKKKDIPLNGWLPINYGVNKG